MPQELIAKLGTDNITTKKTGHGLQTAIQHIKDLNGSCTITFEIGLGTKITIYLPYL